MQRLLAQGANESAARMVANKVRKKKKLGEVDFYFSPAICKHVKIRVKSLEWFGATPSHYIPFYRTGLLKHECAHESPGDPIKLRQQV